MTVKFYLKKRHNLFNRTADFDSIKFEIETDFQLPFVMALCDPKQVKTIRKKHIDLGFFTEVYSNVIENKNLACMTEDLESFKDLFEGESNFKNLLVRF